MEFIRGSFTENKSITDMGDSKVSEMKIWEEVYL